VNYAFDPNAQRQLTVTNDTLNAGNQGHLDNHGNHGNDGNRYHSPSGPSTMQNHQGHNGMANDPQPKLTELYPDAQPQRARKPPVRSSGAGVSMSPSAAMGGTQSTMRSPLSSSPPRGPPIPAHRVNAGNVLNGVGALNGANSVDSVQRASVSANAMVSTPLNTVKTVNSMDSNPQNAASTMPSDRTNNGVPRGAAPQSIATSSMSTVNSGRPRLTTANAMGSATGSAAVQSSGHFLRRRPSKQIVLKRPGYKYGGRGFEVWRRNSQRPMYTTTNLRVNKTFRSDERLARKWMAERAHFVPSEVETVLFVDRAPRESADGARGRGRGRGRGPKLSKDGKEKFTVFRVRTSLRSIFAKMAALESSEDPKDRGVMTKQNNRSRTVMDRDPNRKLYVNNFDILDSQCHRKLTALFLEFGDLEQDIYIDRDRQSNPFAVVQFRTLQSAKRCVQRHCDQQQAPLFYPNKKEKDEHGIGYLNRRLHIEYSADSNGGNAGNRSTARPYRGRGRGRPRGRGRAR